MVRQIQKALHLMPDGIYGAITEEAVRKWQAANGLPADGIVGPKTLLKLIPERLKKSNRTITDIVIHCTATRAWQDYSADDIRRMHKAQGWADIGYHYVVRLDGTIEPGRDVDKIGAHVSGNNTHSIGVVYVGGLDNQGKAKDTRTENQKNALLNLLLDLRRLYPNARISGHRDFSPDLNGNGTIEPYEWVKQCPCFDAKAEYRRI
jgi:N-acetyl-anhydromuramyl-L-alanine amidase AmpD